jgi:hypothetical protein
MADEIEILTENEAGDSWVDPTPSAVSTGYSAQNTNIEALFNGYDKFDVQYSSPNIIINISGIADDNGLPMVVKSQILIDISGQANGTYYLKIIAGSTTLKRSISLVTTPGTWDASKSGFYESGDRILDTIIIKDATGVYLAKRFDNDTKGLKGEFIDTGSGPVKVGQNLRTTDAVTFATVNTGQGANELYAMNQNVRTTDSPTFAKLKLTSGTYGSVPIQGSSTWTVPEGIYQIGRSSAPVQVEIYDGSTWQFGDNNDLAANTIISDGSSVRIRNEFTTSVYIYYLKFS